MKRAIVTGANGFIGSALVKELLLNGVYVYAMIHKDGSNLEINENLQIIDTPIEQASELSYMRELSIDVFYHLAWQGSAGIQRSDFHVQDKNIQLTIEAVKLAARMNIKRFVGAGSIMEKEAIADIPNKGSRPALSTLYSSAKLASHYMSKAVAVDLGIEHIWTYLTAYGVGDSPHRFVNATVKKMLRNEKYIDFTEATQIYDFVYITDVARALFLIGKRGIPYTAYHVGSGNPKPLKEFIIEMKDTLESESILRFGTFEYKGIYLPAEEFTADAVFSETGFKPTVSFKGGVLEIVKEYRNGKDCINYGKGMPHL